MALVYMAIAVGVGLIFSIMELPEKPGAQFYTLFMSALFIVAGIPRFQKFRKDYPVQHIPEGVSDNE